MPCEDRPTVNRVPEGSMLYVRSAYSVPAKQQSALVARGTSGLHIIGVWEEGEDSGLLHFAGLTPGETYEIHTVPFGTPLQLDPSRPLTKKGLVIQVAVTPLRYPTEDNHV